MINIRIATAVDVNHVARNLHPDDKREVLTITKGMNLNEAVWLSVHAGETLAVAPVWGDGTEGAAVALFGCVPDNEGNGVVWMLSTPMLVGTSADIIREAPEWFDRWLTVHPILHNFFDSRNVRHGKWIKKMGFKWDHEKIAMIHDGELTPDSKPNPETTVPFMYFFLSREKSN